MTLKRFKNYNNVSGAWVFQRKTYGAEKAAAGPITLWWESLPELHSSNRYRRECGRAGLVESSDRL